MTSYVYNPSKKVTELLSKYLEFDPEQLQLGIWSGNLVLSDVNLRQDALAPLLRQQHFSSAKGRPPLRLKLVSGKVGSLSVQIPWKRLVWGQGDVRVDLRNVVISVALERCEEHTNKEKDTEAEERTKHSEHFSRDKKQKILRDAEKRNFQGRSIGPWLNAIKKQDAEMKAKKLKLQGSSRSVENNGMLTKWLRGVSNDIFWRFWVGLQMNIENFKIVLVQDSIEIGLLLPMSRVVAGTSETPVDDKAALVPPRPPIREESDMWSNDGSHISNAIPGTDMQEPEVEDNEHVDKEVRLVGIGLYVRKLPEAESKHPGITPSDVYTSDYILRPFEVEFKFSMFFPLPVDKRKRKQPAVKPQGNVNPTDATALVGSDSSTKRRRGKRDKQPSSEETKVTEAETNDDDLVSPLATESLISAVGTMTLSPNQSMKRSMIQRRSSLSGAPHLRTGRMRRNSLAGGGILPLARPDNIGAAYASRAKRQGRTAKFDGKLNIGAIQIVCTSFHYHLMSCFLVSAVQIANGRPMTSIQTTFDQMQDSEAFDDSFSDTVEQPRLKHSEIVRSWWNYAGGTLLFELRQRRRLQQIFEEKYLSFSWSRLTYKRAEYVELFIAAILARNTSSSDRTKLRETLHDLEDSLCIEQILLYRSIARSIHVRGGKSMPNSILELKKERRVKPRTDPNRLVEDAKPDQSDEGDNFEVPPDTQSFLAELSARCETARTRRTAPLDAALPNFEPFQRHSGSNQPDDISFGYASETKSLRTSRSTRSAGRSVSTTAMEGVTAGEHSHGMLLAFALNIEKVEVMLVEGGNHVNGYSVSGGSDDSSSSKDDATFLSDALSVLTDDKRFEQDGIAQGVLPEESESSTSRIYSSSDFLLFKVPEKVILRLVVSKISCESLGRSGDSKNVNLSIGGLLLNGDNKVAVLNVGQSVLSDSPLSEIQVYRTPLECPVVLGATSPIKTLTVSLISKNGHNFVQCDAPKIRFCPDFATIYKLTGFFDRSSVNIPKKLLSPSPCENLRHYILQQNMRPTTSYNCSVRIHGFEINLPIPPPAKSEVEVTGRSRRINLLCLSFDIIELYSGTAVDDLKDCIEDASTTGEGSMSLSSPNQQNHSIVTRQLSMIDVPMMMEAKASPLANHMVCASSGTQLFLSTESDEEIVRILKDAITIEFFCTFNPDSLMDFNRSKVEVTAEVSPLYFLISDDRLRAILAISKKISSLLPESDPSAAIRPPRLEILSGLMLQSIDLSLDGLKVTLLPSEESVRRHGRKDKRVVLAESLTIFLRNVAKFDLNFPHDEALSSSMQICIDHLAGLGLSLEEAWEITNLVMLGFLEDLVSGDAGHPIQPDEVARSIKRSVDRAVALHHNAVDEIEDEYNSLEKAFLLDVADGIVISSCRLFYDNYVNVSIPTIFLSSGSGVHLLRLTPLHVSDDTTASSEHRSASSMTDKYSILFNYFSVDQNFHYGSGGMALSTLGSGQDGIYSVFKEVEKIADFVIGECEILCHTNIVNTLCEHDCLKTIAAPKTNKVEDSGEYVQSYLCEADRFSVTFFADDFSPFARVVSKNTIARRHDDVEQVGSPDSQLVMASASLELIDLTPAGELFPVVISTVGSVVAFRAVFDLCEPNGVTIEFTNLQIVFLRRFLNEILQYFTTSDFGFGRLRRKDPSPEKSLAASTMKLVVLISESSLLLPRSSTNCDMIAFQFSSLLAEGFLTDSTFHMPTRARPELERSPSGNESKDHIRRTHLKLCGARIFASHLEHDSDEIVVDNPSFRFFHSLSGPPVGGNLVFQKTRFDERSEGPEYELDSQRADVVWHEVSSGLVHLDILVDFAPHLRLLICDPVDRPTTGLSLRLDERQYALLLSVWLANMQELPLIFPFSLEELYLGSGSENKQKAAIIPEFGSEDVRDFLGKLSSKITSEIAISVCELELAMLSSDSLRRQPAKADTDLSLRLTGVNVHIVNNEICLTSISSGCTAAALDDYSLAFPQAMLVGCDATENASWADSLFGLELNYEELEGGLPQAFQFCVHMAPYWSIYNLGLDAPILTLADFDTVYKLLDFFTGYFSDKRLGNPNFEASATVENIRKELCMAAGVQSSFHRLRSSGTDFRLWITKPQLDIPCDMSEPNSSIVRIGAESGLWYKYVSHGRVTAHECVSDSLEVSFKGEKHEFENALFVQVIRNLSLGVRYVLFEENDHSDLNVQIPFQGFDKCSTPNVAVTVSPHEVSIPVICKAPDNPTRKLGRTACELTVMADTFTRSYTAILGLLGIKKDNDDGHMSTSIDQEDPTASYVLSLNDIRVFLLDPQLGEHLPLAAISLPSIHLTASSFKTSKRINPLVVNCGQTDFQVICKTTIWADYFKLGATRSWEPLLETAAFECTFERSRKRGRGITLSSSSSVHVNIASAFLVGLDDFVHCYNNVVVIRDPIHRQKEQEPSNAVDQTDARLFESFDNRDIVHEIPKTLDGSRRVAFSFKNMTGVTLRIYRPGRISGGTAALSYLDHKQVTDLKFLPSVSIVRNLRIADVPYPGISNMASCKNGMRLSQNNLSIQVPGFAWHHAIKVDTFGRSFSKLVPIDEGVKARLESSWKLSNAFALLVEVGLQPGGRQVTIQSVFSLINRTDYAMSVELSPCADLQHSDDEGVLIEPGESFHIPPLLLDSSLRTSGTSLGFLYVRPRVSTKEMEDIFPSDIAGAAGEVKSPETEVGRCSKPVDLTRIIEESSEIFSAARGQDVRPDAAITGAQLSCPVTDSTVAGLLSPFCMTLETRRSPLVQAAQSFDRDESQFIHGPVEYELSIFPPIVIKNLLPKRGRFELMHAVRRQVIWYAELDPGQHASAHSIGLDAPLLLFVNLSFARTPVGEGVLVHHGSDSAEFVRNNPIALKTIGKAGKAMTKQLGKTLTAMGESPDLRSQQRSDRRESLFLLSSGEKKIRPERLDRISNYTDDREKRHAAVKSAFLPSEVADEISIIDGLGQRLVLGIENIRGGGGERHISVFSRYWIVNTTEHSLRYKQEKSNVFVSGNVFSPSCDGSKAISSGRSRRNHPDSSGDVVPDNTAAIFAGKPGALAMLPSENTPEDTASLLERDMPLKRLAELSFMFNFQEANVMAIGQQRLCVKLSDGTGRNNFESDWSRGFGLDSIGIAQVVAMHCKDGRMLEITMVVQKPIFGGKTKVIRFLPRYVMVNKLPYPIHIFQDSSLFQSVAASNHVDSEIRLKKWRSSSSKSSRLRTVDSRYKALWGIDATVGSTRFQKNHSTQRSAVFVATVYPSEVLPFFLPDTRRERLLRFDIGKPWNLGPSISTESFGDHTIRFFREVDLRALKHVSTRSSPKYEIRLSPAEKKPSDGELGLWFETEWGTGKSLIVKAVKKGSFAYNETDIHVGDELLFIDGAPVSRMTFAEAMELLKIKMSDMASAKRPDKPLSGTKARTRNLLRGLSGGVEDLVEDVATEARPFTLVFRTIEERMRLVRMKAARSNSRDASAGQRHGISAWSPSTEKELSNTLDVDVELKSLEPCDVGKIICLRESIACPFQVKNQSANTTIHFRQKNCEQYAWQTLHPGQSRSYTWEEPLKPRRLHVRASVGDIPYDKNEEETASVRLARMAIDPNAAARAFRKIRDEESHTFSPPVSFRLDEIGFEELIPLENTTKRKETQRAYLRGHVDVERSTRILILQDYTLEETNDDQVEHHVGWLDTKVLDERERLGALRRLENLANDNNEGCEDLAVEAERIMEDFSEESALMRRDQVIVEVLQANGLNPDTLVSSCNPYAEVVLKTNRRRRNPLTRSQSRDVKRTYYVRRSVNPQWRGQSFVFGVPPAAVAITRGHSVQIAVKNFRPFGRHHTLGRTQIDLHTLRDQEPLEGWFPLAGRTGRRELEDDVSHWGRGSIRMRIQWIYSTKSLINRFVRLSESRLMELEESATGMANQLARMRQQEKLKEAERADLPAVRLPALLSVTRSSKKPSKSMGHSSKRGPPKRSGLGKQVEDDDGELVADNGVVAIHQNPGKSSHDLSTTFSPMEVQRKRVYSSGDVVHRFLEQQRVKLPSAHRSHHGDNTKSGKERILADSATFEPGDFRSWVNVQALSNTPGASMSVDHKNIQVQFQGESIPQDDVSPEPIVVDTIGDCLRIPNSTAVYFRDAIDKYASQFVQSRISFEKNARATLKSALHAGGFLTIRPITALNVSDGYASMTVKVTCGEDVFYSRTVDSSMFPNWNNISTYQPDMNQNDDIFHIHIPPQKTSGSIRIAVIGEKSHQRLNTKVEVGVVLLPIGDTIAVCSRCKESDQYTRWFRLSNPKAAQSKGDTGRSFERIDSEKKSASLFNDYFAPCIQLSLGWKPDGDAIRPARSETDGLHTDGPVVNSYCNASITAFSVALIDSERAAEILSMQILGLDITHWETKPKTRISLALEWLQVDYQDENASEAVVFAPTPKETLLPVIEFVVAKDNQKSIAEVIALDFIDFSMSEFDLNVEENLVFDLHGLLSAVHEGRSDKEKGMSTATNLVSIDDWSHNSSEFSPLLRLLDRSPRSDNAKMKLYVREMFLGGLKLNLSYLKGRRQRGSTKNTVWPKEDTDFLDTQARYLRPSEVFAAWSQNTAEDERRSDSNGKYFQNIPGLVASLLPNLSYAPISLPGKALHHVFESPSAILQNIRKFYAGEILKQIYKIIGSLDFVGNPTMLLSSFMSGVRDMVVAPSVALMRSPRDPSRAGLIFAQGTLSLLSHSASGFFGTLARVSASAGQAVATLSLDPDYRDWHRNEVVIKTTNLSREWKKRGLQNTGRLVFRPLADLVLGVTWGAAGLVIQPIKGFRANGGHGLIKGTAIGVVGLVAKPTVGVLDSFTHFTSGIHDIARSVNVLDKRIQPPSRIRLPYPFGPMGILATYDPDLARAKLLLREFPLKSRARALPIEIIIHVEILPGAISYETVAIATSQRIVVIQVKRESSGETVADLCWQGLLSDDSVVQSRVDDQTYGHGSSLCLTSKRVGDAHSRTESSDDILSEPPMSSSRLVLPAGTPKERRSWKTKETEVNGNDGSVVKRFTIIAEYQFRQQLIRFHNVVCCIEGKLDDLISESILHDKNEFVEGHTSFGLYLFDRPGLGQFCRTESISQLEDLQWVPKSVILEYTSMSQTEQKRQVSVLREQWSFRDELEAARIEGGPAWFTEAKARSRFVDQQSSKIAVQPRTLSWADFEDIPEETLILESEETNSLVPLLDSSIHGFASAQHSEQDVDDISDDVYGVDQLPNISETSAGENPKKSTERMGMFLRSSPISQGKRNESFATANSRPSPRPTRSESFETAYSRPPLSIGDQHGRDSQRRDLFRSQTDRDRLDRMEDLLEQLILYTTENARGEDAKNPVLDRLRRDVVQLRAQDAMSHEIQLLRSEISSLRAQLGSGDGNSSSSALHHLDLTENISAEQID